MQGSGVAGLPASTTSASTRRPNATTTSQGAVLSGKLCVCTREIRKVRFVTNFEYVPQVLSPICPYHQKEKAPKIISIIYQN